MQSPPEDGASESKHYGPSSSESKPRHSKQPPRVIFVDDGESTHSDDKTGQIIQRRNDTDMIVYPPQAIKPSRERETRHNLPSEDRMRVDGDSNRSRAEGPKRQRARSLSSGYNRSYEATNSPPGIYASNNSTTGPPPNNRPPSDGQSRLIDSSTFNHSRHSESTQAPAGRHRPGSMPSTGTFGLRRNDQKSSDPNISPSTGVPGHQSHGALVPQLYSDEKTRKSSSQQDRFPSKLQSDAGDVVASSRPSTKQPMDVHYVADLRQEPSSPLPGTYPPEISSSSTEIAGIDGALPSIEPELHTKDSKDISSKFGAVFAHATRSIFPSKVTEAEEIKRLKAEIYDLKSKNSELEASSNRYRRARNELRKDNQQLTEDLRSAHYQLRQIEQELEQSRNLAETRGKELMGAQVFLTKADSLSQEEITGMVDALNQEIFQIAASLGEYLVFQKHDFKDDTEFNRSLQAVTQILGEGLVQTLINMAHASDPSINPLIIQSVISICLVNFCIKTLQAWYAPDRRISIFMHKTYDQIRAKEEQAVSGRWRAITRAHTKVSSATHKHDLIDSLQSVFNISFWSLEQEGQKAFEHKVLPFFKIIDDLSVALGEKFTSADLQVFEIRAGDKFNHRHMEDVFGDSRRGGSDQDQLNVVVGTAGLGLQKFTSIRSASSGPLQASVELLLPAKVVLASTLQEALEPPTPRKAKQRRD
ncbi:hypothetical protein D9613_001124 [Agrocybe pediades]|uniref:Uncharacterized protein n=1 Tax=Agrocybe pediades TaxID=84607 RepID=A0A8H4VS82_9AGAR|nr:hypothetical protein D9613_001124 [Agrocybe pediades]